MRWAPFQFSLFIATFIHPVACWMKAPPSQILILSERLDSTGGRGVYILGSVGGVRFGRTKHVLGWLKVGYVFGQARVGAFSYVFGQVRVGAFSR